MKPATPTTTVINNTVIFEWVAPIDNGTPLTRYDIWIRKADLTYIIDKSVCDGDNAIVFSDT